MPSPPVIDVEALLAPISDELPAGTPLRKTDPVLAELKKLLPQADTALTEGMEPPKPGQWSAIITLASSTLKSKSKDLEVALRLTNALVFKHGFAGLRDGLKVLAGLLSEYWEGLSPAFDEEDKYDLEARSGPLANMCEDTQAGVWIREIPLSDRTAPKEGETSLRVPVTYNLYVLIKDKKSETFKPFEKGMEDVIRGTAPAFFINLYSDIGDALVELEKFKRIADERFSPKEIEPADPKVKEDPKYRPKYTQDYAFNVSKVREALLLCKNRIEGICKNRKINLTAPPPADAQTPTDAAGAENETGVANVAANGSSNGQGGPITNRYEALSRLREIADFLKQAEPHSPVSYLINRAIAWSEMPFEKLLLELVTDDVARDKINTTLGIKPFVEGSDSSSSSTSSEESSGDESNSDYPS